MLQETKENLPLDAKLLSEAIIELNISGRNVSIYPEGHPSVDKSIDKAFELLKKLFEIRNTITLAIAKDTLIVDHYYLDRNNQVYCEFALTISNLGIASITFSSGITKEEIVNFHKIITSKREDIEASEGILKMMEEKNIKHIDVSLIDYSSFKLSDGKNENEFDENLRENIWETFIYGLLEGRIADSDEDLEKLKDIPPETLALIINKNISNQPKQESYEKVITSYLRQAKDSKRNRGESFSRFLQFIDGLKPSLKKEFMSGTFNYLSVNPKMADEILNQLSTENLLKILQQINEQDAFIPKSLKSLMGKFAKINDIDLTPATQTQVAGYLTSDIIDDIQIDIDTLRLFTEDDSKSYMAHDYQKEIDIIVSTDVSSEEQHVLNESKDHFKEEYIDSYAADVIIELLNQKPFTQNDFINLSNKLLEMKDLFLERGQFREIIRIIDGLENLSKKEEFEDIAHNALSQIRNENFIKRLVHSFGTLGRKSRDTAIALSLKLGSEVIEPLINALMEETSLSNRKFLIMVLTKIGYPVVEEAKRRLDDTRWYVIRNIILLIRECGTQEDAKLIMKFCEHDNKKIKIEALKTLLHFNFPDALNILEKYITSEDNSLRLKAIRISGNYKIKETVPLLINVLKKRDFFEVGFQHKIPIIKALCSIADPIAIEAFIDIYNLKSLLFSTSLQKLKREIFKNLSLFPFSAAKPLIDMGLQSKNEQIREICQKLLQDRKSE